MARQPFRARRVRAVVDARHDDVGMAFAEFVVEGEFDAAGRGRVEVGPFSRTFFRQGLPGQFLQAQGNGHRHRALVVLGRDDGYVAETGHDTGQGVDALGLESIVVRDQYFHSMRKSFKNVRKYSDLSSFFRKFATLSGRLRGI